MAKIESSTHQDFAGQIREMPEEVLIAQHLVQQGAIHALSTLLSQGCEQNTAEQMLQSLRTNAQALRDESVRRGTPELFSQDQTAFH